MKKIFALAVIATIGVASINPVVAQEFNNAGEYMQYMTKEHDAITKDMWDYTNAIARGKKARVVDAKRIELIKTIGQAENKVKKMGPFKNDAGLRDTVISYFKMATIVLKEDYAKIMDMEEIAEQSYDMMEAYLEAKDVAGKKMEASAQRLNDEQRRFAEANNIQLVDADDKISKKLEAAGPVFDYYNEVYLVFFKSYKQEAYMMDALERADVNGIEQNRATLAKDAEEGKAKLTEIGSFKSDGSIRTACQNMLNFYKEEAEKKVPVMVDFYLKKETFEKLKAAIESKKKSDVTKEEADKFNQAVNDYNAAINKYNAINEELNAKRSRLLEAWNKGSESFLDRHVPK